MPNCMKNQAAKHIYCVFLPMPLCTYCIYLSFIYLFKYIKKTEKGEKDK